MTTLINTLLIANRGEIACRVIRSARRMGMRTVAVHSDADVDAAHVALADEAVRIGPAAASASYLKIDAVLDAAVRCGADAIHPGYGFLSENPDFVEAVEAAGLIFVGPSAAAMRAMGLKDAAKRRMEQAGVPVVPGYHGEAQDAATLREAAAAVGYPVLIKARAGGGGKGMRRVDAPGDFDDAVAAARREAKAAFGDDAVLVEKYILSPRHIEVQVFGDQHGQVVHLFERDCSLQRRHQKVLEEAPAPGLPAAVRDAMTAAAVRAARAIDYTGAGTIEFIVDGRDEPRVDGFWFMEMNTRLQVEHPVTEAITGVDLVAWQLRVARGEPLPLAQSAIQRHGHAVEVRLYAEDPASGFLPQTGSLAVLQALGADGEFDEAGLRIDSGVRQGDAVSPHYDPLLAKLIAHGRDRDEAFARLARQLQQAVVLGTITNRAFLARLATHPDVRAARLDTALIERELATLTDAGDPQSSLAAAAWLLATDGQPQAGFRLWSDARRDVTLELDPPRTFSVSGRNTRFTLLEADVSVELQVLSSDPARGRARVRIDGRTAKLAWWRGPDRLELQLDGAQTVLPVTPPGNAGAAAGGADVVLAPMPGRVLAVHAVVGGAVQAGQPLMVLEAMKMEHTLVAPRDGEVESVSAAAGAQVSQGDVLLALVPGEAVES